MNRGAGFTLVEMMVVVAIIGLLVALAVPAYERYQKNALQQEAKVNLSQIYTVEMDFLAQNSSFSACLNSIGFKPVAAKLRQFYAIGFRTATATATNCGRQLSGPTAVACNGIDYKADGTIGPQCTPGTGSTFFPATAFVGTSAPNLEDGYGDMMSTSSFIAVAVGSVSTDTACGGFDTWTINDAKDLLNSCPGGSSGPE